MVLNLKRLHTSCFALLIYSCHDAGYNLVCHMVYTSSPSDRGDTAKVAYLIELPVSRSDHQLPPAIYLFFKTLVRVPLVGVGNIQIKSTVVLGRRDREAFAIRPNFTSSPQVACNIQQALPHEVVHDEPLDVLFERPIVNPHTAKT